MKPTAIVTGGSRGIGLGIVKKLAAEGYNIAICDINQPADYLEIVNEIEANNGIEILYCHCDISNYADHKIMLEKVLAKFGQVNLLVNNAGVAPKVRADITECSPESYDFVMDINLKAPFFLTQTIANYMIEAGEKESDFEAKIINIGSISAGVASIGRGEYCLSKAGMGMLTQLWTVRLAPAGISVYEIRPGVIMTDMTSVVKEKYDKLISEGLTLQPRWGFAEDVAKAAAMLARGDLAYSTGQIINVDGGLLIDRL